MADIAKHLDKSYEQMSFEELADAPVDALQGVSKGDAELLEKAFKIANHSRSGGEQVLPLGAGDRASVADQQELEMDRRGGRVASSRR